MPRVGVILSGCGFQDGSEIHEAVLTLLALDRSGADVVIAAPDTDQKEVIDHRTGKRSRSRRNVLTESARIARGEIVDVAGLDASGLDAVILPGGFGAAKNLSTFAADGDGCTVVDDVAALLRELHKEGKPIGALCIAPAVVAKVLGKKVAPGLTIGTDADTAAAIEKMGASHHEAQVTEMLVDEENRIVSTPCYMLPARISDVATGIDKAVGAVLTMAAEAAPATA